MVICKKCGGIAEWNSYFGRFMCTRCDWEEEPSLTNYDRLVSKTPDEMVEWIESIEPAACPWRDDHGDNCRFTHCRDCWLDWLKSPAEVGE